MFDLLYLSVKLNYNNKFSVVKMNLYDRAYQAMFSLLFTYRKLSLLADIQVDLFDKMIDPILLFGCGV